MENKKVYKLKCPRCEKELQIDPAGSKIWHCSNCRYGWADEIIKSFWRIKNGKH